MTSPIGVTAREIADLTCWARSLAEQGGGADPRERAAFLIAKHALLDRLDETHEQDDTTGRGV